MSQTSTYVADLQSKNIRNSSAFLNRSSLHLISAMFVEFQELNLGCFWVLKISRMRSDIVEQIIICEIDIATNVLSENWGKQMICIQTS